MAGKHSPCLFRQYYRRVQSRFDDFRQRPVVSHAEYSVANAGRYIRFDCTVRAGGSMLLEPSDDLIPLGADRVERANYRYHATVEGGPDVVRYGSPDGRQAPPPKWYYAVEQDHHKFHHCHCFPVYGVEAEKVQVLDREETPTLPEFIEEMLGWYHENRKRVDRLSR